MSYTDNFPYETYRKYQKKIIEEIEDKFENKDNEVMIIEAPPGFGKSAVNVAVAKSFNSAYIITTQKVLQDFYGDEYKLPVIKGRQNYTCLITGGTADSGPCQLITPKIPDKKTSQKNFNFNHSDYFCKRKDECPYEIAKKECADSPVCVMNMTYSFHMPPEFTDRELIIVDEAHNLDDTILDFVTKTIKKTDILKDTPTNTTIQECIGYMMSKRKEMLDNIELNSIKQKRIGEKLIYKIKQEEKGKNKKEKMSGELRREVEKGMNQISKIHFKIDEEENIISQIEELDSEISKGHEWVAEDNLTSIKFTPLTVGRFLNKLLWERGNKILCTSATFLDKDRFMKETGLNGKTATFISVPSSFNKKNRLIYYIQTGKMSYNHREKTLPILAKKLSQICEEYKGDNIIVHAHTYKNINDLARLIKTDKRVMLQSKIDREKSLDNFKNGKNRIFLSVKMTEGIDLKDDMCRVNILAKVPFGITVDKRIKQRMKKDIKWYYWKTIIEIVQAYGRTTRSEYDYSDTYILDNDFGRLYNNNTKMFPEWFREALIWEDKQSQSHN